MEGLGIPVTRLLYSGRWFSTFIPFFQISRADEHDRKQQHEPHNAPTQLASGLAQSRKTLECLQVTPKFTLLIRKQFATSSRSMIYHLVKEKLHSVRL